MQKDTLIETFKKREKTLIEAYAGGMPTADDILIHILNEKPKSFDGTSGGADTWFIDDELMVIMDDRPKLSVYKKENIKSILDKYLSDDNYGDDDMFDEMFGPAYVLSLNKE